MATTKKPSTATTQAKAAPAKAPASKSAVGKPVTVKPASQKVAAKRPVSKTAKAAKVIEAAVKPKKPKLVRDSFTIPKAEYAVIEALKQRAATLTRPVKKSELIRAGIKALAALSNAAFLTALNEVPTIKTGRPALKT